MSIKVLFVCIHNSARSQMAEAFLRQKGGDGDRFQVESAGLEPGNLNPVVVEAMQEIGIDISKNKISWKSPVAKASGGSLASVVKLGVFLTDLAHFPKVNEIMGQYFTQPYPARAAVGVASLPKGSRVEADAVLVLE